jgi:hypothetical protein
MTGTADGSQLPLGFKGISCPANAENPKSTFYYGKRVLPLVCMY